MLNPEEKAKRLKAALAKSIAESIKYELRSIILCGERAGESGCRRLVRQRRSVTSFGDLHDYLDANMLPPQAEWLLNEPLVVESRDCDQFSEDLDGRELAVDVLNMAQDEVDVWIKDGGLVMEEVDSIRRETEPYGV